MMIMDVFLGTIMHMAITINMIWAMSNLLNLLALMKSRNAFKKNSRYFMKKSKNAKRYKTAGVGLKTTISADGVKGFFARGKIIAKLVDRGKAIPRKRIINFDTPEEMLSVLTKERRKLMLLLRKGAFSISQITRLTHRDRSVITKDVKLLEY